MSNESRVTGSWPKGTWFNSENDYDRKRTERVMMEIHKRDKAAKEAKAELERQAAILNPFTGEVQEMSLETKAKWRAKFAAPRTK